MKTQIEPVSTEHLLNCLGLAIDEAKLVRSLIQLKDIVRVLKEKKPFSERLIYLNKEIQHLETKLIEVRSKANRG